MLLPFRLAASQNHTSNNRFLHALGVYINMVVVVFGWRCRKERRQVLGSLRSPAVKSRHAQHRRERAAHQFARQVSGRLTGPDRASPTTRAPLRASLTTRSPAVRRRRVQQRRGRTAHQSARRDSGRRLRCTSCSASQATTTRRRNASSHSPARASCVPETADADEISTRTASAVAATAAGTATVAPGQAADTATQAETVLYNPHQ
jgi:hypothetical protein